MCSALDRITISKIVDRVLNKVIAQVMSDVSSDTDTALVESKEDNVVQIVPAKCVKATQRKHISGRKWTENQNTHNPMLSMVYQKKL
jgi:hypothetical protein